MLLFYNSPDVFENRPKDLAQLFACDERIYRVPIMRSLCERGE